MDATTPRLITTRDGSHSLYAPQFDQHYHSLHGAVLESQHIYIGLGLSPYVSKVLDEPIRIFEMGLGSGLNALLTWQWAGQFSQPVHYVAIEAYPLRQEAVQQLNFEELTGQPGLRELHQTEWGVPTRLSPHFVFTRYQTTIQAYTSADECYDVIYYDAFSPDTQPELWTEDVFRKVAAFTRRGGHLVTYCTKGDVKRALRGAGFRVRKYPGPWGKRDVLRAVRE